MEGMRAASMGTIRTTVWLERITGLVAGMLVLKSTLELFRCVEALGEIGDYFRVLPVTMLLFAVVSGYGLGIAFSLMLGWCFLARRTMVLHVVALAAMHLAVILSAAMYHCSCITFREAVSSIKDWSGPVWAAAACFAVLVCVKLQTTLLEREKHA